ncbi:MAG TPA: Maf family protein [Thermoguttaceae bacterium]|nr:Maf family protein [Thermoguttaceae bacterium]
MNPTDVRLILASRSPRRRELLAEAGYRFEVVPPDETAETGVEGDRRPEEMVRELAWRKAADVAARLRANAKESVGAAVVLGCDTVVECEGHILGKPIDRADARRMLETLRGQRHRVLSGLCLWPIGAKNSKPLVEIAISILQTDLLSDEQLDEYLSGNDWQGKAGAFGYQDRTGWVHVVEGSESNVVGLPLELLAAMLKQFDD